MLAIKKIDIMLPKPDPQQKVEIIKTEPVKIIYGFVIKI